MRDAPFAIGFVSIAVLAFQCSPGSERSSVGAELPAADAPAAGAEAGGRGGLPDEDAAPRGPRDAGTLADASAASPADGGISCALDAPSALAASCRRLTPDSCGPSETIRFGNSAIGACEGTTTRDGRLLFETKAFTGDAPPGPYVHLPDGIVFQPLLTPEGWTAHSIRAVGDFFHGHLVWNGQVFDYAAWNAVGQLVARTSGHSDFCTSWVDSQFGKGLWRLSCGGSPLPRLAARDFVFDEEGRLSLATGGLDGGQGSALASDGRLLRTFESSGLLMGLWCGPTAGEGCGPQFPIAMWARGATLVPLEPASIAVRVGASWVAVVRSGESAVQVPPGWLAQTPDGDWKVLGEVPEGYAIVTNRLIELRGLDGAWCGTLTFGTHDARRELTPDSTVTFSGKVVVGEDGSVVVGDGLAPCVLTRWPRLLR